MPPQEEVRELLRRIVGALDQDGLSSTFTRDPVRAESIVGVLAPIATADVYEIQWAVINGRRVDVAVRAAAREWRAVLSIDSEGVHSASVGECPATFLGVPGGRAVIVNGPSSAGKSSVMEALVNAAQSPWVMFDELAFGKVAIPFLIWRDSAPTLLEGFVAGITGLAAAGNQVILTGGGQTFDIFDRLRSAVPTLTVGLNCPLDVRIERQKNRPDRWGGLTEGNDNQHDGWTYDLRFDTSLMTADEIARQVLERVHWERTSPAG